MQVPIVMVCATEFRQSFLGSGLENKKFIYLEQVNNP